MTVKRIKRIYRKYYYHKQLNVQHLFLSDPIHSMSFMFTKCLTYPCDELWLSVDLDQPALHHLSVLWCKTLASFCIAFILKRWVGLSGVKAGFCSAWGWWCKAEVWPSRKQARHIRKVYFSFCTSETKKSDVRVRTLRPNLWENRLILDDLLRLGQLWSFWQFLEGCYLSGKGETYQKLSLGSDFYPTSRSLWVR